VRIRDISPAPPVQLETLNDDSWYQPIPATQNAGPYGRSRGERHHELHGLGGPTVAERRKSRRTTPDLAPRALVGCAEGLVRSRLMG